MSNPVWDLTVIPVFTASLQHQKHNSTTFCTLLANSVADPWHFGKGTDQDPFLRLTDLDPPLVYDADIFVSDLQDANEKNIFALLFFLKVQLHHFFFKDKKSQRSHKTVGIKVFLTILALWWKDPDQDPHIWLTDPDANPGGPKTLLAKYKSLGKTSVHSSTVRCRSEAMDRGTTIQIENGVKMLKKLYFLKYPFVTFIKVFFSECLSALFDGAFKKTGRQLKERFQNHYDC